MNFEIETKILNINRLAVLAKVSNSFQIFSGVIESTYYKNDLDKIIRVSLAHEERYHRFSGSLTIKSGCGIEVPKGIKIMEEYNINILKYQINDIKRMFELLGYSELKTIIKHRDSWILGNKVRLEFDVMQGVPEWLEIEKQANEKNVMDSVRNIQETVKELGYSSEEMSEIMTLKMKG